MELCQRQAHDELETLVSELKNAERILVVVGAGLSEPSGLPTFRQHPHFWGEPIERIANLTAFHSRPDRTWSLYEDFRQIALSARPNPGHVALAALAAAKPQLLVITQNIDGKRSSPKIGTPTDCYQELSERAGHRPEQIVALHGSIFDVSCADTDCGFKCRNVDQQGMIPAVMTKRASTVTENVTRDTKLQRLDIPDCPLCESAKLRPGVIWFGERLPPKALERVEDWLRASKSVEIILVIGTERYPFVRDALDLGAKLAWFDIFEDMDDLDFGDATWIINGDASKTLPFLVEHAVGPTAMGHVPG